MKIYTYFQLHLFELKYNIIIFLFSFFYLFFVLYLYSNQIIFLFTNILLNKIILKYFIFTNITEIFMTNFYLSFSISSILMSQLFCFQIWFFLYKGFFKYENFKLIKFYILYIFFNIFILIFIFIKIIPNIWFFLININIKSNFLFNIYFEPRINNYFLFILQLYLYLYLLFLYFFIFFYILIYFILHINTIIKLRKIFYLKFLLISLLITPPEINTQIFLFLIFIIIFEFLIFIYIYLNRYFRKKC